jgi:subtilisin family serine protease
MPHRARAARAMLITVALLLFGLPAATGAHAATTGAEETYLILYRQQAVPSSAADDVTAAGGTLVAAYDAIGVVVARSTSTSFRADIVKDTRVEGAAATTNFGSQVRTDFGTAETAPGDLPNAPAADADSLSGLQWDMRQIHTPEAHAVTGGSPAVVVGDIDTGLDFTHPDLAPNYSPENSADCSSGVARPLEAGNDRNGHGTHTAGTIAAAANGIGIVGVAPNVKIAGIKSSLDNGTFLPEMVVCSFMWAGDRHLDVTNNSYFADPFLYNCRNDQAQHAIWKAEQRAILYAMNQGVTVVAAAGNESDDLSHPALDTTSPDYPPGIAESRDVTNACVVIPVEIPGVVGVSAVGHNQQADKDEGPDYLKSFYSSYGVSAVDVTAPGGDSVFGVNAEAPNGRVLSTWPPNIPCARSVKETPADPPGAPTTVYCYLQGTSMASPHVAGVAALIVSRYGDTANPENGKMRPGSVAAYLSQTADQQPCPETLPPGYSAFTQTGGELQSCQGGPGFTSWYGNGQVNAFRAVTHIPGG